MNFWLSKIFFNLSITWFTDSLSISTILLFSDNYPNSIPEKTVRAPMHITTIQYFIIIRDLVSTIEMKNR